MNDIIEYNENANKYFSMYDEIIEKCKKYYSKNKNYSGKDFKYSLKNIHTQISIIFLEINRNCLNKKYKEKLKKNEKIYKNVILLDYCFCVAELYNYQKDFICNYFAQTVNLLLEMENIYVVECLYYYLECCDKECCAYDKYQTGDLIKNINNLI